MGGRIIRNSNDLASQQREKKIKAIQNAVISSQEACAVLGIGLARLNAIRELRTIIRGYYLRDDVINYAKDEDVQKRRERYGRTSYNKEDYL